VRSAAGSDRFPQLHNSVSAGQSNAGELRHLPR
jgi:hypothetical protein